MKNHPISLVAILVLLLVVSALGGPVSHFGALKVCKINIGSKDKGRLCGEKTGTSTPVFVKGPSLYWSTSSGLAFYNAETVDWFVDNMQIGVIRAAMAIRYYGNKTNPINGSGATVLGYYDSPAEQKTIIKRVIDAAILNDIYVIVDWHSHNAEDKEEASLATAFFTSLANEYRNVPNIIWEVYNEPIGTSFADISTHAKKITDALRNAGNNNLVLIGSPNWSQQPKEQAQNWGTSSNAVTKNVAFTFHFYAGTHPQSGNIGTNAADAMDAGYAVFGSEWGSMNSNGAGNINSTATSVWTKWMDDNNVSNCAWSASSLNETASMFKTGTSASDISTSSLTDNGNLFKTYMSSNKWTIPNTHPDGNDISVSIVDGGSVVLTTQLGLSSNTTVTGVSQPEEGSVAFTANSVTYTTSASGSNLDKVRFTYKIIRNNITAQRRVTVKITRGPVLPQKNPIVVSRKTPTRLHIVNHFSATDPSRLTLSFKEASLSTNGMGTVNVVGTAKDTLLFTPDPSQRNVDLAEVNLNYSIQNTAGAFSSANVTLRLQNLAPIVNKVIAYNCCLYEKPNTAPIGIGMGQVQGRDPDGDSVWFERLYLHSQYPGRLEQVKADSFVYYPDDNKTGKVIFLSIITDGSLHSELGKSVLVLTGNGQSIGDLPVPAEIPGYVPIISKPLGNASGLGIMALGSGKVEVRFAQNGFAKLDVYSLSGKYMGTLLSGYQSIGSSEILLSKLNLQKGIYILQLRQDSQIKTLRIIN